MNVFTNVHILLHRQWSLIHLYNTGNFMAEKDSGRKKKFPKVGMLESKRQNSSQRVKYSKIYSDPRQSLETSLFALEIPHCRGRGGGGGGRQTDRQTDRHRQEGIREKENGRQVKNIQEYTDTSMSLVLYIHTSTTVKTGWHRRIWFCLYTPVTVKTYTDITCN